MHAIHKNQEGSVIALLDVGVPDIDRFTVADCQAGTVKTPVRRVPRLRFIGPSGILRGITIAKVKACPGLAELMAARNQ